MCAKIEAGGKRAGELRALGRFQQKLKTEIALEAGERRSGGAENFQSVGGVRQELAGR